MKDSEAFRILEAEEAFQAQVRLEARLKNEALSNEIGVPVSDPAYALRKAFLSGQIHALVHMASVRSILMKGGDYGKKNESGEAF